MTNIAIGNQNPFRHTRRAGCIDHISRAIWSRPIETRIDSNRIGSLSQTFRSRDITDNPAKDFGLIVRRRHQQFRTRIIEAHGNTINRSIPIKREPCSAGFGNGNLRHQQIGSARHPQADNIARLDTGIDQPPRNGRCIRINFGIGPVTLGSRQSGCIGTCTDCGSKQFGQKFIF